MKSGSKDNKDRKDNIPILNCFVAIYLIIIGILQLIRWLAWKSFNTGKLLLGIRWPGSQIENLKKKNTMKSSKRDKTEGKFHQMKGKVKQAAGTII